VIKNYFIALAYRRHPEHSRPSGEVKDLSHIGESTSAMP